MLDPLAGCCQFGRQRFRVAVYNRRVNRLSIRVSVGKPAGPNPSCHILALKVIDMSSDEIPAGLTASTLEAKWKNNLDAETRENTLNLRMRRALSWLERAEQERDDPDAAFIFYWIAFNAAYAVPWHGVDDREQDAFEDYFTKIAPLDNSGIVYNAIWMKFNGPIKALLKTSSSSNRFGTLPRTGSRGSTTARTISKKNSSVGKPGLS